MKSVLGFFFTVAVILSCSYVSYADKESSVLDLTEANFEDTLKKYEVVLVEFYAPWCGHCKRLAPEYEILADAFSGNDTIAIAKVDCTVEEKLARSNGIRGFPTIKLFKNGKLDSDYGGERTSQAMIEWIKEKSLPKIVSIEKKEQLDALLERKALSKVVAFVSKADEDVILSFGTLSDEAMFDDLLFGFTLDKDVAASLGRDKPSIEIFTNNEWKKFEGEMDYQSIYDFIFNEAYPKFEQLVLSQEFVTRVQKRKLPLVTVFVGENENMSEEDQIKFASDLSESVKGKALFTHGDSKEYANVVSGWGGSGKVFPTVTILKFEDDGITTFAFDETKALTLESATEWIEGCLSGKECPTHLKSDPVPEKNDGPVKTVVGKTYDEIVYDTTKDVLVKFYTPTCPHCQKMAEAYVELGKKYENDETLVIAELDATTNTFADIQRVRGFPTILLFKANDKQNPIAFENAERTVENMSKFLEENRKTTTETEEVKEVTPEEETSKSEEENKKDEL